MLKEKYIEAQNISFNYPSYDSTVPNLVLNNISISINEGEFVAVLGKNGSGKSTLAKHFNAILIPSEGTVSVDGIRTAEEEKLYEIRKRVGMVFQNPDNQIVATVVEEDVAFALENLGVEPDEIRERVDDALKKVDMYDYRLSSPDQLSGGQKQRVAIAGIIAMKPKCIVLDEATAMLDPKGRKEVLSVIHSLNKDLGITVVLITHYMNEAVSADRIVVVDEGEIIASGTPKEIFAKGDLLMEKGLSVPQVTQLCSALEKDGILKDSCIINEDECVKVLEDLLKGGTSNV